MSNIKEFGVPVKSYAEEPLTTIFNKYGIPGENGESFQMYLETAEQEGDIVLTDFISEEDYKEEIDALNALKEVIVYDEEIPKEDLDKLPKKFFKDVLIEKGINVDDLDQVIAFVIFNKEFNKAYFIGYQLQSVKFGVIGISYKL